MLHASESASHFASFNTLPFLYALGKDADHAGNRSISVSRISPTQQVILTSNASGPSGFYDILCGGHSSSSPALDHWKNASIQSPALIPPKSTWSNTYLISGNNFDFPITPSLLSANTSNLPLRDLRSMLTGIYGSPVGCLCTFPNLVKDGVQVARRLQPLQRDLIVAMQIITTSSIPIISFQCLRCLPQGINTSVPGPKGAPSERRFYETKWAASSSLCRR